ncbi:hypothetical protein H6F90_02220 [Trichocoleus sp. FACHB-591]|uniref:hypothetical protein n=1 Tax=Trichocoleus sp. FACHB-591 TaxID=2692872 RepID=UPI00168584F6|nr:hypothetical protein [Trichocoleus sp. FACHB-591]MBD2093972.1 hypothetical protein [Trichocoleus sp. FACHB-591]
MQYQYLAGLIVFAGVGSFLLTDTIDFFRDLKHRDRRSRWYVDLLRLLFLAGITTIGYKIASETFRSSQDQVSFLAIGLVGAVVAYLVTQGTKDLRRS